MTETKGDSVILPPPFYKFRRNYTSLCHAVIIVVLLTSTLQVPFLLQAAKWARPPQKDFKKIVADGLTMIASNKTQSTTASQPAAFQCLNKGDDGPLCGCNKDANIGKTTMEHLAVPPNSTFETVNRTELIRNVVLSLEWDEQAREGALSAFKCNGENILTHLTTKGMTFRVAAQDEHDNVRVIVHTQHSQDDERTRLFLPEGTPSGKYSFTVVLIHVDHQGEQDPPCKQSLTLRTHCLGETLWFDSFVKWIVFENILVHNEDDTPTTETTPKPACTSIDQVTPGHFQRSNGKNSFIWHPTHCTLPGTFSGTSATAYKNRSKILLVGDSTLRRMDNATSFTWYIKAYTPSDLMHLIKSGVLDRSRRMSKYSAIIVGLGLHSTCYNPLQNDLKIMESLVKMLRDNWDPFPVVLRSTPALGVMRGLDYNAKKCIYYTQDRLQVWNDNLRQVASDLNVTYWDAYNTTASVGIGLISEGWAATDGTHYCSSQRSSLCQQFVNMADLLVT